MVTAWPVKPVPPNLLAGQVAAALGMTAPHIQDDGATCRIARAREFRAHRVWISRDFVPGLRTIGGISIQLLQERRGH
jgi:hypothetical protein